jgi:hypothetical protein
MEIVTDKYKELDLDGILCQKMQIVANLLQNFGTLIYVSADHIPQSHVSTVSTIDIWFTRCCATQQWRREEESFIGVADAHPRPPLPRLSGRNTFKSLKSRRKLEYQMLLYSIYVAHP